MLHQLKISACWGKSNLPRKKLVRKRMGQVPSIFVFPRSKQSTSPLCITTIKQASTSFSPTLLRTSPTLLRTSVARQSQATTDAARQHATDAGVEATTSRVEIMLEK